MLHLAIVLVLEVSYGEVLDCVRILPYLHMFPGSAGCAAALWLFLSWPPHRAHFPRCSEQELQEASLLCRGQIRELEESVRDEVEDAVKFADESPKPVRPGIACLCPFQNMPPFGCRMYLRAACACDFVRSNERKPRL